jgi:8-amino-7-oxononanoate synthase
MRNFSGSGLTANPVPLTDMEVSELTGGEKRRPESAAGRSAIQVPRTSDGLSLPLQQLDRTHVLSRGRKLVYVAGCDYFRLASHPQILEAIRAGLDQHGLNVAASRRTTGNHALYEELEQAAAAFFTVESATLVSTGYQSNLCVAQALAGEITHVLLEEKAHGSLRDAARFLGCPILTFQHPNATEVQRLVKRCGARARIILMTDGLLSQTGEVAPLDEYLQVLPSNARLLVDDAHAAGVLGRHGRGSVEHLQLPREQIIQTITLSKAFGVYGGVILGPRWLRRRIIEHSGIFVGNTPLPLPLAAGALKALEIVRAQPGLRRRLAFNASYVKAMLQEGGFSLKEGPGPIIPIQPRSSAEAQRISRALLRAGIHPPLIQYQAGPTSAYFRFAISSEHEPGQLETLAKALCRAVARPGPRKPRRK